MGTIPAPNIVEAANQISRNPLTEYARATQLDEQQQQFAQEKQQRDQAIEAQNRQFADQDALTKTMTDYNTGLHKPDDIPGMISKNGGSGEAALAAQQHILTLKKTASDMAKQDADTGSKNLETQLQRHDAAAGLFKAAEGVPDEQLGDHLAAAVAQAQQQGWLSPDEVQHGQQLAEQARQNPQQARQMLPAYENGFKTEKQIFQEAKDSNEQNVKQQEANSKDWQKDDALGLFYNTRTGETKTPMGQIVSPAMMESKYVALQQKKNAGQPISKDDAAWVQGYEKYKTLVPQFQINMQNNTGAGKSAPEIAKQFGMSPEAFDQTAEKYGTTGQLPPIGRGGSGIALNKAIMNRYAELHPGATLAANSADYKANAASLAKLQTNFDQVSAFEGTAQKNIDLFLSSLKNIPDLGVKFANVPLRMIDDHMIGSDNYQAMKAAQQTASTEAAKVLGSANASGVLSDTQKKDAEDILSGNLSYSAAQKVAATLKQDFANRHQSYQEQIADIKQRMGPATQSGGAQSTGHKVGDLIVQGGRKFKATKVDQNGKVLAADPQP